jgi:GT2 family glycosyltransferase
MGRIVIGVLTWNGYDLARACIESLTKLRDWPVSVVVVDNGSREAEGQRLAEEFGPPVSSIRLARNAAVAGGYNAAIRWAAGKGATHILLLNNDTVINDAQLLSRLAAAAGPDVAAVGPILLNEDGLPYAAGGQMDWTTGLPDHPEPLLADRPYPVEWLDGPCILLSLEAVRRIGGLDPVFVSYWEDVDWCVRAGHAGYQCVVEPRASIVHLVGGTIPAPEAHAYNLRNGMLFMRRNGSALNNLTTLAYFVLRRLPGLLLGRQRLRGRNPVPLRSVLSGFAWNVRDAMRKGHWRLTASGPSIEQMPLPTEQTTRPLSAEES